MTPDERAAILQFMANNGLPNAHNFLYAETGLRPHVHFSLSLFAWPLYQTAAMTPTVLIFTSEAVITVSMPLWTHTAQLTGFTLASRYVTVYPTADIINLSVDHRGTDYWLCLQTRSSHRYFYLYIDERDPSVNAYNLWHLMENDFFE
ncbi:hypothetical protein [Lacticaseibacillus manihotivorans]|uniref:Uncharacterized protein n=2 Tax=Lacticaseibacillus manihotivorans TaxID=88233 RepID=A0A0R1QEI6_9LACO|nr:hypothetical protein [Lacticaseibacillus manihotivorans]KRL43222.1 hypothetical protein FD01_GL001754 [Lacticaseibacillus manihotivorans DSM 13343 = JCM 12514]QFQ92245.1 hypothetical protein LM010_12825 [Lacticaseibacillus manihotivorans]